MGTVNFFFTKYKPFWCECRLRAANLHSYRPNTNCQLYISKFPLTRFTSKQKRIDYARGSPPYFDGRFFFLLLKLHNLTKNNLTRCQTWRFKFIWDFYARLSLFLPPPLKTNHGVFSVFDSLFGTLFFF